MKALVYTNTRELTLRKEPDPIPGPDEVLFKVEAAGICGSDLHAFQGKDERRIPPLILGHEAAGTVLSGRGEGHRAVINPLITCGSCDYCSNGRSNLCSDRELIGMRLAGTFAEYVSIPEKNLVYLPKNMEPEQAALTEPTATAIHALNLAGRLSDRPLAETNTLIIGGGAIGLLTALMLKTYGCRRITLSETSDLRRSMLEKTVFCRIHNPLSDPSPENSYYDLVIDAVGLTTTRKTAIQSVKAGGTIIHVGLGNAAGELDMRKLTLAEITLQGVYTYTPADIRGALEVIHNGSLGSLDWVEHRELGEGASAFSDLINDRTASAKIILKI